MTTPQQDVLKSGRRPMVKVTTSEVRARVRVNEDSTNEIVDAEGREHPARLVELPPDINIEDLKKGRLVMFSGTLFIPNPSEGDAYPDTDAGR